MLLYLLTCQINGGFVRGGQEVTGVITGLSSGHTSIGVSDQSSLHFCAEAATIALVKLSV